MKKLLNVFCAILLLQTSCKTDVDLLAPYKETMVVYGLLDPSQSTQYIRINRAFLGEGDAYAFAQIPDSINYRDILDVKLERYREGVKTGSDIQLERFEASPLDSGIFASQPNILYRTLEPDSIYQDSEYKIIIHNRETQVTTISNSSIVNKITSFDTPSSFGVVDIVGSPYFIKWYAGTNAKFYDVAVTFHYGEKNKITNDYVEKSVSWVVGSAVNNLNETNPLLTISLPADAFFSSLRRLISVDQSVDRYFLNIDFVYTGGTSELYTYYQVNRPPTGIVQSIPDFTNIDDGVGIFSSRYTQMLKNKSLSPSTKDTLLIGKYTYDLGFVN